MFSMFDTIRPGNDYKVDLSGYAIKADTASKIDLDELKLIVANKLDANPVNHEHSISQIQQLQEALNNKLSVPLTQDSKYSYNTLLKDWQKIPYLENVKIPMLSITNDINGSNPSGYILSVDKNGDLLITLNDIVIASYNKVVGTWIFNGVDLAKFIKTTNDTLKNHYDAIVYMLESFHNHTDADNTDGNIITPTSTSS